MNPFELPGPQFLLFYAGVGVTVVLALRWMRRHQETALNVPQRLEDPYLFALLRGGEDEAVRVALTSLLDRKLVIAQADEQLARAPGVTPDQAQREIERAILGALEQPHLVYAVLTAVRKHPAFIEYKDKLKRLGLLPDAAVKAQRVKLWMMATAFLLLVAGIKINIGLSRNRPITFLVIEAVVFLIAVAVVSFPRRTATGDEMVKNMKELFRSLKDRASSLRPGGGSNEAAWLAAVFGIAALPTLLFPYQHILLPKNRPGDQTSATSCGSSCASSLSDSSSGGSSCGSSCGGGGGGCGGCGG